MELEIPTYSKETTILMQRLRHPANRMPRVLLNPVKDNTITISMNETVDAEIRVYNYDDGVTLYEAIAWVDDVNGVESVVTVCVTTDWKELRSNVVEFYHRFM